MALPTIKQPIFSGTYPNSNATFSYRPFNVEEQKSILIASQGGSDNDLLQNLVNMVDVCTFGKEKFRNRSVADFEKAFLSIRSKSVGEVIEIGYRCLNETGEPSKKCNHKNFMEVDFLKETKFTPAPDSIITVNDTIKLKLKPVTMDDVLNNVDVADSDILYSKIEWVSEGEEIFTEFTSEEFEEFSKSIPLVAAEQIIEFFKNQSTALLDINTKCKKCGNESTIEIKGSLNFFG